MRSLLLLRLRIPVVPPLVGLVALKPVALHFAYAPRQMHETVIVCSKAGVFEKQSRTLNLPVQKVRQNQQLLAKLALWGSRLLKFSLLIKRKAGHHTLKWRRLKLLFMALDSRGKLRLLILVLPGLLALLSMPKHLHQFVSFR
ncbi:hypothetical protein EJ06DRAFT_524569 [Trichodelitschia bisporula]|uniref:Uncharacterized protein n=1 Tax=Trichodelitschia bisporula TaxID=703511 RepID=A0A6G1HL30_9PEZI|nr:hypothetical protein EJ06DRAFT_524569 [Trichodelitschia bisporula]